MTTATMAHKNKTVAACLASLGGTIGLHRFYLAGLRDKWGWLHVASLPLSLLIYASFRDIHPFFAAGPLILSALTGCMACLVMGTTSDEKWDAKYNVASGRHSETGWPLPLLLVLTLAVGAGSLIAVIARTFDLLFTGGMYG